MKLVIFYCTHQRLDIRIKSGLVFKIQILSLLRSVDNYLDSLLQDRTCFIGMPINQDQMIMMFPTVFATSLRRFNERGFNLVSSRDETVKGDILLRYTLHVYKDLHRFSVDLVRFEESLMLRLVDSDFETHLKKRNLRNDDFFFRVQCENKLPHFFNNIIGWIKYTDRLQYWWKIAARRHTAYTVSQLSIKALEPMSELAYNVLDEYMFRYDGIERFFIRVVYEQFSLSLQLCDLTNAAFRMDFFIRDDDDRFAVLVILNLLLETGLVINPDH